MKTQAQVRKAFWEQHPAFQHEYRKTWRQNQYNATIRATFIYFVDYLRRDNQISEKLAQRVTL